jgi:SAM-dependent methyltransferase
MSVAEYGAYLFDNAWVEARRRLALLEESLDPATFRRLETIGVGTGWRCLDVGSGGGSVARWLARRVGDAGSVLATDIDTRFLVALDEPNLEVRQHDITADPMPDGGYDLVHTRLVLMHLPARAAVLSRLAAALKPGGWLLVEEHDVFPIASLAAGAYARVWGAFMRIAQAAGAAADWGRDLPTLLSREGLVNVAAEADGPLFPGGAPYARFWSLTWEQVRPRIESAGATSDDIDQACKLLGDASQWFAGPAMVAAWGQRPCEARA